LLYHVKSVVRLRSWWDWHTPSTATTP